MNRRQVPNLIEESAEDARLEREAIQWVEGLPSLLEPEPATVMTAANWQAALDGGMKEQDPPFDSAAAAWIRLPLQLPMLWGAWRVAHS